MPPRVEGSRHSRRLRQRRRRRRTIIAVAVLAAGLAIVTSVGVISAQQDRDSPRRSLHAALRPSPQATGAYTDTAASVQRQAAAVATYAATREGTVAFAVVDLNTGLMATTGDMTPLRSASIVKVTIAVGLLRRLEAQGVEYTSGQLSSLTSMIESSDNDAASSLWRAMGSQTGLRDVIAAAGLTSTTADSGGAWGFTLTNPIDQARLLRALWRGELLNAAHTQLVLDLMRNVTSTQRWGISEAAPAGSTPAIKNGWYPDTDEPVWRVHCLAIVDELATHSGIAIAIMTRYPNTLGIAYGQATCREATQAMNAAT